MADLQSTKTGGLRRIVPLSLLLNSKTQGAGDGARGGVKKQCLVVGREGGGRVMGAVVMVVVGMVCYIRSDRSECSRSSSGGQRRKRLIRRSMSRQDTTLTRIRKRWRE